MIYKPRNDFVLYRIVDRGSVRGLAMPQRIQQGKDIIIIAIGPKVEGLKVGDCVLAIGTKGQDLVEVPNESKLYLTREQNVVVVIEGEEEE